LFALLDGFLVLLRGSSKLLEALLLDLRYLRITRSASSAVVSVPRIPNLSLRSFSFSSSESLEVSSKEIF
jgi:hypothetical protein